MVKISNEDLGRPNVLQHSMLEKHNFVVVLDNVRSLSNVGSVFRTCDALGAEKLFLTGISGTPPNRELHKTALGAEDSVAWQYYDSVDDCILYLKNLGYIIVIIEQINPSVLLQNHRPDKSKKYAYIFGNEVDGITDSLLEHGDFALEIPQFGTKHSLNISVSVGIVLWQHVINI